MKCVLGILASLSLISCPSAEFSKAPAYNKRFGFNISHSGLLSNVDYAVQQDGPNWHIRLRSGELRYDPDTIHLTPEEIVELEDDDEHYRTTRTIRDGDQIVAAGGLALASHSFRQALQDPNFYQETIKSRNLKTLYPVFEKHGTKTDQIQGYVQMTFISPNSIPLQLHPGTEEAREAERQLRVQEESQRQLFLIQQRKEKMEAVRKQEENYNYFEITIEKKKKTELLFDPKAFPLKLTKRVQYLKEGDELISCNGVSVLEGDVTSAFTTLKTADYPKVLKWRRFIDVADDINLQLGSLQITSPKAAMGCFAYRMAKFGDIPPCNTAPIRHVRDSCRLPKTAVNGSIVLGFRSNECSFEQRFENFQDAGAIAGVVANTEDSLLQMIAKNNDNIEIPAVLVGLENGVVLRRIIQLMEMGGTGSFATARIGDGLICGYDNPCPSLTQDEVEIFADAEAKRRKAAAKKRASRFVHGKLHKGQEKERTIRGRKFVNPNVETGASGTMHFWNGNQEGSFKYQLAKFGLHVPDTPQQVLWGSDRFMVISEGCKTTGMEKLASLRKFERVWVIFARGTCSYTVKTKVAQSIGAAGLIVVNNVNKLMRMPFSEGEDLSNIEISSVLISKKSGEKLLQMLPSASNEPAIVRFEVDKEKAKKAKQSKKARKRKY